ncbi:hypothetical protein DERF_002123 [Dermatophagoides farinae]|uniref:Uncharacterized protein n=1 Tax=Dermatophagoides farinae TaxID=6954 RepID=A0A922IAY6_DERFA|nr:hypothetical protein DERF_002123 [Dermatophagoides farinae]
MKPFIYLVIDTNIERKNKIEFHWEFHFTSIEHERKQNLIFSTLSEKRVLRPSIRSCGHINMSNTAETVPVNITHELHTNNVVS